MINKDAVTMELLFLDKVFSLNLYEPIVKIFLFVVIVMKIIMSGERFRDIHAKIVYMNSVLQDRFTKNLVARL